MMESPGESSDPGRHIAEVVRIDADAASVFARWTDYERLPQLISAIHNTRLLGETRVLWDVEIAGHQVVWEAAILESAPPRRIAWQSRSGAPSYGTVSFEELPGQATRLSVDLWYAPRTFLERVGARLGIVRRSVARGLRQFKRAVERDPLP